MPNLAAVRARARSLVSPLRREPRRLADMALQTARTDEQLAFEMFRASKPAVLALSPPEIESLLTTLHDWNSTDCFACFVSGVAWREGTLSERTILDWTRSENRWVRRAALVSTVPLNLNARGATAPEGEPVRTLKICARLIDDRDDMVVKALSWALRTLSAKDPAAVQSFVDQHRSRLAPRVLRETSNKLTTGLKTPKRPRSRS